MSAETLFGLLLMCPLVALTVAAVAFFFGEVRKDMRDRKRRR